LTLTLCRTPDILGDLGKRRLVTGGGPILVGFAAETEDVVRRGTAKLERKQVDLIVANDVSLADRGFDVETNEVTIIGRERADHISLRSKSLVAAAILDRIESLVSDRAVTAATSDGKPSS
jgi:phosphopantothenoylcysteine decarboxylase/phosphopantothenate--cysteine ligase